MYTVTCFIIQKLILIKIGEKPFKIKRKLDMVEKFSYLYIIIHIFLYFVFGINQQFYFFVK